MVCMEVWMGPDILTNSVMNCPFVYLNTTYLHTGVEEDEDVMMGEEAFDCTAIL